MPCSTAKHNMQWARSKCIVFKMISRNKDKCYLPREPAWLEGAEGCFHLLPQVKKTEREREMYTMIPPLELTLWYNKSVLMEQKMGFISMAFPKELLSLLILLLKSCFSFVSNTEHMNLDISLPLMEQEVTNYNVSWTCSFFKVDISLQDRKIWQQPTISRRS